MAQTQEQSPQERALTQVNEQIKEVMPSYVMAASLGIVVITACAALGVAWALSLVGLAYCAFVALKVRSCRSVDVKVKRNANETAEAQPEGEDSNTITVSLDYEKAFKYFCNQRRVVNWELFAPFLYIAFVLIVRAFLNALPY